jgi:hypothetical protein
MKRIPPLPHHLGHKPLVAMKYADFDGPDPVGTDAMYLSIGHAQWDEKDAISAKVWRHPDSRWSRQSEELPLHRPIDLTILIAAALKQASSGRVHLRAGTFENQDADLDLPVYGSFEPSPETADLIRRRLVALVRLLNEEAPDILEEAGLKTSMS